MYGAIHWENQHHDIKSPFNVICFDWRDHKTRLVFSSFILLEKRVLYAGIRRYGRKKKKGTKVSGDEKQLHYKKLLFLFVAEPYFRLLLAASGRL